MVRRPIISIMSSEQAKSTTENDTEIAECRACLQKLETRQLSNLFQAWTSSWEGMKSTIAEDLSVLADVQLKETDKHSKLICSSCCSNLSNACKFKLSVQENDKILRQRYPETDNQVAERVWPQPIQVEKSVTGVYNNPLEIEIKQEVLTDDENMGNGDDGYTSTNCVDMIKIEPEEIAEPVTSVPPSFRVTEINGQECLEEEDETPMDSETDQPNPDKAKCTKDDTEVGTKEVASLTHADIMDAVAKGLSKPVEVIHEKQLKTPELDIMTKNALSTNTDSNAAANPDSILEVEQSNIDKKVQNPTEKHNEHKVIQKTALNSGFLQEEEPTCIDNVNDEALDKCKPNTMREERKESASVTDIFVIDLASPCADSDDEVFTVTTNIECDPEKAINVETSRSINVDVPLISDSLEVECIDLIPKNVEMPKINEKKLQCTSKLDTLKLELTEINEDIETTPFKSDASPFRNLTMSSEKLENVSKPEAIPSELKNIYMNTNKELSQKLDSLSETVSTVLENQKILADTQEKILAHVMGMGAQFEKFMKQSQNETSPDIRTNSLLDPFMEKGPSYEAAPVPVSRQQYFKPIDNSESLKALEESLKDSAFEVELRNKFLAICGVGKCRAGSSCYILLDLMFDRKFLTQCSWSGGSRHETIKVCFRVFKNVIHFFFSIIYASDKTFTLVDCEEFFRRILRNSMKRQNAKMMRASTSRRRLKKRMRCDKSDSDNDTPQQEIDETMFLKSLMEASSYETVRDVT